MCLEAQLMVVFYTSAIIFLTNIKQQSSVKHPKNDNWVIYLEKTPYFFNTSNYIFKANDMQSRYAAFRKNLLIRTFLIAPKCIKIRENRKKYQFGVFFSKTYLFICFKFAWLTVVGMQSNYAAFRKILLIRIFLIKLFRCKNPFL